MSDHIPFEIQEEIIKRLPVKSLIRFRLVSKPWNSLIDSSKFIANYHIRNPRLQHHILVSYYTDLVDGNSYEQYVLIADDDTFPQQKLSLTIPRLVCHNMKVPDIIGYSKGLFCFYSYSDYSSASDSNTAVLWNPAIRKSISIVVPNVFDGHRYQAIIGFGVCPHTSDPKLVKIAQRGGSRSDASIPLKVEIFTLSTGAWRSSSIDQFHGSIAFHYTCVTIDEFIYWLAYEGDEAVIMSFDMTIEEFKVVYLPDSIAHSYKLSISKLKESLVVLENSYKDGEPRYDVWMMKHGVPKSFTMLFSIDPPNFSILGVLGFRMNGEPITKLLDFHSFEYPKLFIYKPNSRHIHIGISANLFSSVATSYTETLLLLHH